MVFIILYLFKATAASNTSQPISNDMRRSSKTKLWATDLLKKGRSIKPITPINGLSIGEKFFYLSPADKPQVIMTIWCSLTLPPNTKFSVERIVDILRLSASEHYRLTSSIDSNSCTFVPVCDNISEFHPNVRVIERKSEKTQESVLKKELNTNFVISENRPLWKIALVVSPKVAEEYRNSIALKNKTSDSTTAESKTISADGTAGSNELNQISCENNSKDEPETFMVACSFHHCLGDGLSMWAFTRTFTKYFTREYFMMDSLNLETIKPSSNPPAILDNLMNPTFWEIFPGAMGLLYSSITSKRHRKFKGNKGDPEDIGSYSGSEPESPHQSIQDLKADSIPKVLTNSRQTNIKCLFYDAEFMSQLRKRSKAEGTTIAAVLVVNALAAVRSAFANHPKYKNSKFPVRQGWVVTNSMRHLLPESKLLYGADKQTDPSINVFGGYAGSVANANLKLDDKNDFWERCRTVRRGITSNFIASLNRLKLANYLYRRPKLFEWIKKKVNIDKLSRQFSVELANLGAWDHPLATMDAPSEDPKLRLKHFGGMLNSSFEGARGLFSIGVITLGGYMSVMITYDKTAVGEKEAELFEKAFDQGMNRAKDTTGKLSILNARSV